MTGEVDGRRARGQMRRQQLVDAAVVVLGRDGLAGLTHRAVAEQAGVPLASASYHFSGIDDLIATAMQRVTDDLVATLAGEPAERTISHLAQLLADEITHNRQLALAEYEVYLYTVRRPHLRQNALTWLEVLSDRYAPDLDDPARRALQATIEGICLHAMLTDGPADASTFEHMLQPRRRYCFPTEEASRQPRLPGRAGSPLTALTLAPWKNPATLNGYEALTAPSACGTVTWLRARPSTDATVNLSHCATS